MFAQFSDPCLLVLRLLLRLDFVGVVGLEGTLLFLESICALCGLLQAGVGRLQLLL